MKHDKKLIINIILTVLGVLFFAYTLIFQPDASEKLVWILASIILLIASVIMIYKRHGKNTRLTGVLFILLIIEVWAFVLTLAYDYPELGTVISG